MASKTTDVYCVVTQFFAGEDEMHVYVCVCVCMHVRTYVRMYVCMYYVCTYVCM